MRGIDPSSNRINVAIDAGLGNQNMDEDNFRLEDSQALENLHGHTTMFMDTQNFCTKGFRS